MYLLGWLTQYGLGDNNGCVYTTEAEKSIVAQSARLDALVVLLKAWRIPGDVVQILDGL